MGKINSKKKGSEYELKIAKTLSKWWGEEFHRTPMSGGLRWGEDSRVVGDIVTPPDSLFPFTVECKKREGWDFSQLLKGTGDIEKWWDQSINDAIRVSLYPTLIFAKNFSPNYFMVSEEIFSILTNKGEKCVSFNYLKVSRPDIESRIVCVLEDFIKEFSKQSILEALSEK